MIVMRDFQVLFPLCVMSTQKTIVSTRGQIHCNLHNSNRFRSISNPAQFKQETQNHFLSLRCKSCPTLWFACDFGFFLFELTASHLQPLRFFGFRHLLIYTGLWSLDKFFTGKTALGGISRKTVLNFAGRLYQDICIHTNTKRSFAEGRQKFWLKQCSVEIHLSSMRTFSHLYLHRGSQQVGTNDFPRDGLDALCHAFSFYFGVALWLSLCLASRVIMVTC